MRYLRKETYTLMSSTVSTNDISIIYLKRYDIISNKTQSNFNNQTEFLNKKLALTSLFCTLANKIMHKTLWKSVTKRHWKRVSDPENSNIRNRGPGGDTYTPWVIKNTATLNRRINNI